MKYLRTLLLALAIVLSTSTLTEAGEPACKPFNPAIFDEFYEDHGESKAFQGASSVEGDVITVIVNPVTKTFSILISRTERVCLVAEGTGAALSKPVAPGGEAS